MKRTLLATATNPIEHRERSGRWPGFSLRVVTPWLIVAAEVRMSGFERPGRTIGNRSIADPARATQATHAPGKQTLTEQLEIRSAESPHGGNTEHTQLENPAGRGTATTMAVQTTIPGKGQGSPETREGATQAPTDAASGELTAHSAVAPGGAPAVGAGANDCVPSTASAVVTWNVMDAGANWRADVASLTLSGRIRINPWPSSPTSMTVPNTPNPVVGGNINNTAGSANHWQAAIDDMADYDTAGGGAGPNWHSTAASTAHEWAHWNGDYVGDAVTSALVATGPQSMPGSMR